MSNQAAKAAGYNFAKTHDPKFLMSNYALAIESKRWKGIERVNWWDGYNKARCEYLASR
jgi:hypothetical protein